MKCIGWLYFVLACTADPPLTHLTNDVRGLEDKCQPIAATYLCYNIAQELKGGGLRERGEREGGRGKEVK